MDMIVSRNIAIDSYDHNVKVDIVTKIRNIYYKEFITLKNKLLEIEQ